MTLAYSFDAAAAINVADRTSTLGGKGAALVNMCDLGLAVPPGFTFTTSACRAVLRSGWSGDLDQTLLAEVNALERATGCRLGDADSPLLVSVRSGAPTSMPGMMDTVLNAGMTTAVARTLSNRTADGRFGWDTYRRFLQSYAAVVCSVDEDVLRNLRDQHVGADDGAGLDAPALQQAAYDLRHALDTLGHPIPDEPIDQIRHAVQAVFGSWHSDRARTYRRIEGIADDLGTAATVQAMTFGNLGPNSGTGVVFTRDPATGGPGLIGDFLVNAQGEDVVAGTHATRSIDDMAAIWPDIADELRRTAAFVEHELGDMADIEFTVEDGKLWLLQVRSGKRSPAAALRIAIDMAEDPGFPLDRAAAVDRCRDLINDPPQIADPNANAELPGGARLATGLAASPGRAVGSLCTDIDDTIRRAAQGESVILVRRETSPADIAGMAEASGLVTTLGGMVSHAAVVARAWGVPAVVGVADIKLLADGVQVANQTLRSGTIVTIDGDTGQVLLGDHRAATMLAPEVATLRSWAAAAEEATDPSPSDGSAQGSSATVETDPADVRRVLGLKGMGTAEGIAEVLGFDESAVAAIITDLVEAGDAQQLPGGRVRLIGTALDAVSAQYATDAAELGPVIEPHMHEFHAVNAAFKQVVTSWQLRTVGDETVPNDHDDDAYDASVVARVRNEIHARIAPIIADVTRVAPRFGRYATRFEAALDALEAGQSEMMAHPLKDSYHTIWFELHEEFIRLTGRNRADEAAAGRG